LGEAAPQVTAKQTEGARRETSTPIPPNLITVSGKLDAGKLDVGKLDAENST
jgi:hypothetical protein